jgi:hypothetical protein
VEEGGTLGEEGEGTDWAKECCDGCEEREKELRVCSEGDKRVEVRKVERGRSGRERLRAPSAGSNSS